MKSVHQKYDPPQLIARESPVVIKNVFNKCHLITLLFVSKT